MEYITTSWSTAPKASKSKVDKVQNVALELEEKMKQMRRKQTWSHSNSKEQLKSTHRRKRSGDSLVINSKLSTPTNNRPKETASNFWHRIPRERRKKNLESQTSEETFLFSTD